MVATGQKDTFNNVVMVFCNIDGYAQSTRWCCQSLCMCISLVQPIYHMRIKHMGQPNPFHTMHVHQATGISLASDMHRTSINPADPALHMQQLCSKSAA